jgi:predicted GNAT family acetyltransferase
MKVVRYATVGDFHGRAGTWLAAREAEHNLILGITSSIEADASLSEDAPYLAVVTDDARIAGVAIRTPPYNLVLSEMDGAAAEQVAEDLRGEPLPGVVGPPDAVRAFAEAWVAATGGSWRVARDERIFRLERLDPPPPVEGVARLALPDDAELLERWLVAFTVEALDDAETGLIRRGIEAWRRGNRRRYWFWEVADRPVSLVGSGGETPNGIRIGPVYTPPGERGRGYASNLTAWVTRTVMNEGRRYCFLYTDLANPTSNQIYRAIGYEPVTDAMMVAFAD